jgi:hypothetical protein
MTKDNGDHVADFDFRSIRIIQIEDPSKWGRWDSIPLQDSLHKSGLFRGNDIAVGVFIQFDGLK